MKRVILLSIAGCALFSSCHKNDDNNNTTTVTSSQVITDFVNKVALPQYQALQDKATILNTAVNTLNTTPSAANLTAAQAAWREVRTSWEGCEGFLVGPVEDSLYDPNMDTWPVDYIQLDSFMTSSNLADITVPTVAALQPSLRGFHPLEYILWGKDGNETYTGLTDKNKKYMIALSQDILNTCTSLNNSWLPSGLNFQQKFLTAGAGSTRYATKKDALKALVAGMSDICNEVGTGKMVDPFLPTPDSTKTESPFSHNSMTDFTNNIRGAQYVYTCTFNGVTGSSLSRLVAQKNLSLDNKITLQFATAIIALNNVTVSFESALYTQPTQLHAAIDAITTLQATLDGDLKDFIEANVKD